MQRGTIAGYTTTYQCLERHYPFIECVQSLLGFCDEVVVVDAGSTDGTIEAMRQLAAKESRLKFYVEPVDFNHPRWAIHMDGALKAKARALCTSEFCWQTDTDEIVSEHDFQKIRALPEGVRSFINERPVIYLPMVEFWGSWQRIRADFFSWKPRFSKNDPRITHGIPKEFREYDVAGHPYPRPFESDSCNYMWLDTSESVPMTVPYPIEHFSTNSPQYDAEFLKALDALPSVLHLSWLDLKRKIEHYREFWPKFHASMYLLADPDTAERNVMFDKPWAEVTDQDIAAKAEEMLKVGPRSFHTKLNPNIIGKTMPFQKQIPQGIANWARSEGIATL